MFSFVAINDCYFAKVSTFLLICKKNKYFSIMFFMFLQSFTNIFLISWFVDEFLFIITIIYRHTKTTINISYSIGLTYLI